METGDVWHEPLFPTASFRKTTVPRQRLYPGNLKCKGGRLVWPIAKVEEPGPSGQFRVCGR